MVYSLGGGGMIAAGISVLMMSLGSSSVRIPGIVGLVLLFCAYLFHSLTVQVSHQRIAQCGFPESDWSRSASLTVRKSRLVTAFTPPTFATPKLSGTAGTTGGGSSLLRTVGFTASQGSKLFRSSLETVASTGSAAMSPRNYSLRSERRSDKTASTPGAPGTNPSVPCSHSASSSRSVERLTAGSDPKISSP